MRRRVVGSRPDAASTPMAVLASKTGGAMLQSTLWKLAGSRQSYCRNKQAYFFGPPCRSLDHRGRSYFGMAFDTLDALPVTIFQRSEVSKGYNTYHINVFMEYKTMNIPNIRSQMMNIPQKFLSMQ